MKKGFVILAYATLLATSLWFGRVEASESSVDTDTTDYTIQDDTTPEIDWGEPNLPMFDLDDTVMATEQPDGTVKVDMNVHPSDEHTWKRIDKFSGSSTKVNKLSEWTARFLSAAIPAALTKNSWATAASGATFNTIYHPPKTRYYVTYIYEDQDYYWNYGRVVELAYSDSAHRHLVGKKQFISRAYRAYK